jgi:DNA-binding NtrC family response regulator
MAQAHILVVDDEPDIRNLVSEILADEGYSVQTAANGETARTTYAARQPDLVLLDIWMPDIDGISLLREWSGGSSPACPVVMMSGHGTLETAVEATRLGAHDFIQKPLSLAKLLATVRQALGADTRAGAGARPVNASTRTEPLGNSPEMQLLRQRAGQAARHASPVLVTGETGSGREDLASYIHRLSGRNGEFGVLDHCQMRSTRARAYLLGEQTPQGHVPGLLDQTAGGTLYIPDLCQLDEHSQSLVNGVLETGNYVAEGAAEPRPVEARFIVGANPDLEQQVGAGRVLESLYYQVNVLPLNLPPLRSRPEDIPDLVRFFAEWFPSQDNLTYRAFSVAALNRMRNHSWPGNVRELRNLVQRLLILGGEGEVSARELEHALQQNAAESPATAGAAHGSFDLPLREAREQFEREYLEYQLRKAGGSVGKLSESVGMERTHLYRKLRALGIDPKVIAREGDPS